MFLNGHPGRFAEYQINLIIGIIVFALVLGLLDNKKFPAALVALAAGVYRALRWAASTAGRLPSVRHP